MNAYDSRFRNVFLGTCLFPLVLVLSLTVRPAFSLGKVFNAAGHDDSAATSKLGALRQSVKNFKDVIHVGVLRIDPNSKGVSPKKAVFNLNEKVRVTAELEERPLAAHSASGAGAEVTERKWRGSEMNDKSSLVKITDYGNDMIYVDLVLKEGHYRILPVGNGLFAVFQFRPGSLNACAAPLIPNEKGAR